MEEVVPIYKNDFGFGFYWRKSGKSLQDAVQIIFRDIGFYLSKDEIISFSLAVENASKAPRCTSCTTSECCRSILLRTPSQKIDLAVNRQELSRIDDLLKGILFHMSLLDYVRDISLN